MIKYNLKNSRRAKRLKITINRFGMVTITRPWFVPQFFVNNFIEQKQDWILKNIIKIKNNVNNFSIKVPRRHRQAYLKYKEEARKLINDIIEKYNDKNQFEINKIRIKNPKTLWGSCSINNNLNFSYRLIYMPRYIAEYIVVHELCHLKELNHSKKFWKLVSSIIPNYKDIEKELKKI